MSDDAGKTDLFADLKLFKHFFYKNKCYLSNDILNKDKIHAFTVALHIPHINYTNTNYAALTKY